MTNGPHIGMEEYYSDSADEDIMTNEALQESMYKSSRALLATTPSELP